MTQLKAERRPGAAPPRAAGAHPDHDAAQSAAAGPAALHATRLDTPVGTLLVVVDGAGALTHVLFDGDRSRDELAEALGREPGDVAWDSGSCAPACTQLTQYFAGERRAFDLPLAPEGSAFERSVWDALRTIPYGTTASYGAIAARLGQPNHARAVGRANGANPLPIVVPCHRVIGADGRMVGYGGEVWRKEELLRLEGALLV